MAKLIPAGVLMWADTLACQLLPRLGRWTVVVVDEDHGDEYPIQAVRLRSRAAVDEWMRRARARWVLRGMTVDYQARRIERATSSAR